MKSATLLCALLLLVGCSRDDRITRIQIWHQMQPEDRAVLTRVIADYDARLDSVEIEVIYKETEELRSNYQSAALAGLGPDLLYGPSDQVGPMATMQFVRPLDDLFAADEWNRFDERAVVKFKGKTYQLADRIGNHLALVYNKKLMPEPPRTTDELITMGRAATKDLNGDGVTDQWGLVWNFTEPFFFIPWLSGFGGWVLDDQARPTLNTKAAADAFRFVRSLRDEHKMVPPDCDYNTADALFKEGRAAMLINGPWSWSGYGAAGIDYGLARIPQVTSTGLWPAPMVSPLGYSINVHSDGKELAATVELLRYLISDAVQREFVAGTGIIPSSLAVRADSSFITRPHVAESLSQFEVGRAMPTVPELRAVWDAMRASYQSVLGGYLTPEAAAAKMQRDAEQKIQEMNE
ncbi:MAG: extracellular solute-binding protein [bacterium]|nr:extracellular solute-binding protein [bacterium]MBK8127904.1 extracellular solute-binding protein [bacterium]